MTKMALKLCDLLSKTQNTCRIMILKSQTNPNRKTVYKIPDRYSSKLSRSSSPNSLRKPFGSIKSLHPSSKE